jgi:hypothetical protein
MNDRRFEKNEFVLVIEPDGLNTYPAVFLRYIDESETPQRFILCEIMETNTGDVYQLHRYRIVSLRNEDT